MDVFHNTNSDLVTRKLGLLLVFKNSIRNVPVQGNACTNVALRLC